MSIQDVIAFLKSVGVSVPVYPYDFPLTAPTDCATVDTGQGLSDRGDVSNFMLMITLRSDHPDKAEKQAIAVNELLRNLTNKEMQKTQVVLIKPQQKLPAYVGKDDNGKYYFECDFSVLVSD